MFKLVVTAILKFFTVSLMLEFLTYNYFNGPTKLFSSLYLTKFLDILAKPFFSLKNRKNCDNVKM